MPASKRFLRLQTQPPSRPTKVVALLLVQPLLLLLLVLVLRPPDPLLLKLRLPCSQLLLSFPKMLLLCRSDLPVLGYSGAQLGPQVGLFVVSN